MDPEFTDEAVGGAIDIVEVDRAVDRGEERSIQPTTTLGDQLGDLERNKHT
jgi:hypothetical protein